MLGSGSKPNIRGPCPVPDSQGLTIRTRFLTTRPDKFKASFQTTTTECKTNEQTKNPHRNPTAFKIEFDVFLKRDYTHEPYYRKGLYRATQKVQLRPVFGLRTGENYRISAAAG